MRILVLHGYSSNAAWCKKSDKQLQWLLGPLQISLYHVNAPIDDPYCNHRFCWWRANEDGSSYMGWDETIKYLENVFEKEGPFDGVMGHSQGASCAAALIALMADGRFKTKLRFAMFSGGFLPRDPQIAALFPVPTDHPSNGWCDGCSRLRQDAIKNRFDIPTLHVVGKRDKITPPALNTALAARFQNPVLVHHDGGHKMAVDTDTGRIYLKFLSQFVDEDALATFASLGISERSLCSSCCKWYLHSEGRMSPGSERWYCSKCWDVWSDIDSSKTVLTKFPRNGASTNGSSILGCCTAQCGYRKNWHSTHCCKRCADTHGMEHDWGRCERWHWSMEVLNVRSFRICFPHASTLGKHHGGICAFSVDSNIGGVEQAKRAAEIFFRYGFVILRKAITSTAASEVLKACQGIHEAAAKQDEYCVGNRNPGRYSFNNCTGSGHCLHIPCFVKHLVDNSFVLDVLDHIYKAPEQQNASVRKQIDTPLSDENEAEPFFIARGSGDFCCGWVESFQKLHSDIAEALPLFGAPTPEKGLDGSPVFGWFGDTPLSSPAPIHDRARPPTITVNYAVQSLTRWNGPMRILTWDDMASYATTEKPRPPTLLQECRDRPDWLASRIFPLEAGDALVRDVRVWHGGCPNLSGETRYLPSVDVTSPEYEAWFQPLWEKQEQDKGRFDLAGWALPIDVAANISDPRARKRCRDLVEQRIDGEANHRVGDLTWVGKKVAREQWPKPFIEAELGAAEVALAGFLAELGRALQGNMKDDRLQTWLCTLVDGTFPLMLLLDADDATKNMFNEIVAKLQSSLRNSIEAGVDSVKVLAAKLDDIITGALDVALSSNAEMVAEGKRRRLE